MNNATALPATSAPKAGRGLHIGLWIAQALLAAAFLMSGGMKLTAPLEALQAQMPWVSGAMGALVRFIGAAEVAGALGLLLPSLTRIAPRLTVLAAIGLGVIMVLASITHASRGEFPMIGANVVLGGVAAFIAWGRSSRAPIAPRG